MFADNWHASIFLALTALWVIPPANSFDGWHPPRVSYSYSCFFNPSLTDKQRYPTLLAIFRPSITSHLRKFYPLHFVFFFFLISQSLCVLPMVQFFFHMKFRFSILWKNDIGVFWDEFPSNNGFNTKHLSIVAKKKAKGSNMHFADSAKQGNVCLCFRGNKLMCFVCICTHLSRTHGYTKHSCCVITNTFVRPFSVSPYGFIWNDFTSRP